MRQAKEGFFPSFDDVELFYRVWEPLGESDEVVLLLHRGHEHSGRVAHMVEELQLQNRWVFSFDLRGHGKSPGSRGWAPSFDTWVKDLNAFSGYIRRQYQLRMENAVVVANSVGSVMAVQWVHDYAPGVRGMVLAAPAFKIKLYVPLALPTLKFVSRWTDRLFVTSYVKSKMLTRDRVQAESYDQDPLITKRIAVSVLVTLFESSKRLLADAAAIETPVLILSAGSDYVVDNRAQEEFFNRVSSFDKQLLKFPNFRHAILHERDREQVMAPTRKFIDKCLEGKKKGLPMVVPQPRSFSLKEVQRLSEPGAKWKQVLFYGMRRALEVFGPLSEGMRIGLHHGFDSGVSLDYVYQNRPQGRYLIGKAIDWFYLNAIGWRGIRHRKEHLKEVLRQTLETVHAGGQTPVVLDCAAGGGRYLFESVREFNRPVRLHLRDLQEKNLELAKRTASQMAVTAVKFEKADAFQLSSYDFVEDEPNVVIVSGLFELFSDNNLLGATLSGIQKVMKPGGYLLYTGQPWHPQLEMIARVLNNHAGRRWIMRPRAQAELDDVVKFSGFEKMDTVVDELGIFTVSIARKECSL